MKKVLINFSNIHVGGALQVAISVASEFIYINTKKSQLTFLISTEIANQLDMNKLSTEHIVKIYNTYGISALFSKLNFYQYCFDAVFTLFGPKYTLFTSKKEIVGFAQGWILEFDNPISRSMPFFAKKKLKLKFAIQKYFYQRADHLIVELEHVKNSLHQQRVFDKKHISVVYNSISHVYLDSSLWQPVHFNRNPLEIAIGFITRDYPHKNINILAKVAHILHNQYRIPVKFYFSLAKTEWHKYQKAFNDHGETVGALTVFQCPSFYQKMDAVIFPSILECFSATPFEALSMKKPLFASNRQFVKDICQNYAFYFDPLEAKDIAKVIGEYFSNKPVTNIYLEEAKNHVLNFSNAKKRALDYIRIIENV